MHVAVAVAEENERTYPSARACSRVVRVLRESAVSRAGGAIVAHSDGFLPSARDTRTPSSAAPHTYIHTYTYIHKYNLRRRRSPTSGGSPARKSTTTTYLRVLPDPAPCERHGCPGGAPLGLPRGCWRRRRGIALTMRGGGVGEGCEGRNARGGDKRRPNGVARACMGTVSPQHPTDGQADRRTGGRTDELHRPGLPPDRLGELAGAVPRQRDLNVERSASGARALDGLEVSMYRWRGETREHGTARPQTLSGGRTDGRRVTCGRSGDETGAGGAVEACT